MSYADDLRTEIEVLKKQLDDLGVQRIERDTIIAQKLSLAKEIEAMSNDLDEVNKATIRARENKKREELQKNAEIEMVLKRISLQTAENGLEKSRLDQFAKDLSRKEAELGVKGASLGQREATASQREKDLDLREKSILEAKNSHNQVVLAHEQRVADHVARETAMNTRESDLKVRETKHEVSKKTVEEARKNIDNASIALDLRKTSLDKADENLKTVLVAHSKQETELIKREQALDVKTKEMLATLTDINNKSIANQTAGDNLTFRELECQAKERALDKRERILFLKEQEK